MHQQHTKQNSAKKPRSYGLEFDIKVMQEERREHEAERQKSIREGEVRSQYYLTHFSSVLSKVNYLRFTDGLFSSDNHSYVYIDSHCGARFHAG